MKKSDLPKLEKRTLKEVSTTTLHDFLRCPMLYAYRNVMGIELREISIPLFLGSALHYGLSQFYSNNIYINTINFPTHNISKKHLDFMIKIKNDV